MFDYVTWGMAALVVAAFLILIWWAVLTMQATSDLLDHLHISGLTKKTVMLSASVVIGIYPVTSVLIALAWLLALAWKLWKN